MKSPSTVSNKLDKLINFVYIQEIVGLIVVVIILSVMFFPKRLIYKLVSSESQAQPVAVFYLNQLILNDASNKNLIMAEVKQQIANKEWGKAEKSLQVLVNGKNNKITMIDILWLKYLLAQRHVYATVADSPERELAVKNAQADLNNLLAQPISETDLIQLANDAVSLGLPQLAFDFYSKLIKEHPEQNVDVLRQAAAVALSVGQYKISGDLYFNAVKRSKNFYVKRDLVLEGIKAYQGGGFYEVALNQINQLPPVIIDNKKILIYLAKFAVMANKPDEAEKFIKRALAK